MQSLTDQALEKARKNVAQIFAHPDALDGLGVLSYQLEKQLVVAESQLNNAVQSKLDSLKRAVDLMDESTLKLTKLSTNISRIDEKIAQTNTAISNYDNLKKVHNARDNLSKVISQVEFFAKVPERVEYLREKMNSTPSSLKEVFLEAIKLESLRVALMKEIQVTRNRNHKGGNESGTEMSADMAKKIRGAVTKHLSIVPDLVEEVENRVLSNVERMFDLAADSPAVLVMSFEIIEMQQEYNTRRNNVIRELNASGNTQNSIPYYDDISGTVQANIRKLLDQKVEGEFELMEASLNSSANSNGNTLSVITSIIMAANQTLQKITLFKQDVVPCMPPHYEPIFVFLEAFEWILIPKIDEVLDDISELKVSEILDFINWIEYHYECMQQFGFGERECIAHLSNAKTELMMEYKDRIKKQVMVWFDNIKKQPVEISKASDGTLVTPRPEDMFNIIHAQLEVAREKLPPDYTKEVGIACLQVLQQVQRDAYDDLSNNWQSMDAEAMCALINDNQRMKEKCIEFGEHLMRFVAAAAESSDIMDDGLGSSAATPAAVAAASAASDRAVLQAMLDAVSLEYVAIASKAVNSLARCIMEELDEPIYTKLYSPDWESGEHQTTSTLIATLEDYFHDLSSWLTSYYYHKFVQEVLNSTVDRYVMYIRKRNNGVFVFRSELSAANRILKDKITLQEFFDLHINNVHSNSNSNNASSSNMVKSSGISGNGNHNPFLQNSAAVAALEKQFEPMIYLARIISARHPSGVESDIRALYTKWGIDGFKLILAALQANPTVGKPEKIASTEIVKKMYDAGLQKNGTGYSTKPLPDYISFDAAAPSNGTAGGNVTAGDNNKSKNDAGKAAASSAGGFWGRRKT